jgi:hypothetical protein
MYAGTHNSNNSFFRTSPLLSFSTNYGHPTGFFISRICCQAVQTNYAVFFLFLRWLSWKVKSWSPRTASNLEWTRIKIIRSGQLRTLLYLHQTGLYIFLPFAIPEFHHIMVGLQFFLGSVLDIIALVPNG